VSGELLPSLSWNFTASSGSIQLSVQPGRRPAQVIAWKASSATRDFRDAQWSSRSCSASGTGFRCVQPVDAPRYTAVYSEVSFKDRGETAFSLSTAVCIVDAAGAMVRQCLDNSSTGSPQSPGG
jgi:hypothetical protein